MSVHWVGQCSEWVSTEGEGQYIRITSVRFADILYISCVCVAFQYFLNDEL